MKIGPSVPPFPQHPDHLAAELLQSFIAIRDLEPALAAALVEAFAELERNPRPAGLSIEKYQPLVDDVLKRAAQIRLERQLAEKRHG